jgi:hypothetical protein
MRNRIHRHPSITDKSQILIIFHKARSVNPSWIIVVKFKNTGISMVTPMVNSVEKLRSPRTIITIIEIVPSIKMTEIMFSKTKILLFVKVQQILEILKLLCNKAPTILYHRFHLLIHILIMLIIHNPFLEKETSKEMKKDSILLILKILKNH